MTCGFSPRIMASARTFKGMSQVRLAGITGLSTWDISRMENGRLNPTEDELKRIKAALDWDETLADMISTFEALGKDNPFPCTCEAAK